MTTRNAFPSFPWNWNMKDSSVLKTSNHFPKLTLAPRSRHYGVTTVENTSRLTLKLISRIWHRKSTHSHIWTPKERCFRKNEPHPHGISSIHDFQKDVDKRFWAEELATATYVINRVTTRALPPIITPHHLWMGHDPDLEHLRIFESPCWYVLPRIKTRKLDIRSRPAILLGYSKTSKRYRLWDEEHKKIVISRSVRLYESSVSNEQLCPSDHIPSSASDENKNQSPSDNEQLSQIHSSITLESIPNPGIN